MNDNLHALDRLIEAVHELVTHAGRVQERLSEANHYLGRIRLDVRCKPSALALIEINDFLPVRTH